MEQVFVKQHVSLLSMHIKCIVKATKVLLSNANCVTILPITKHWDASFCAVTRLGGGQQRRYFSLLHASVSALGPMHPHVQWASVSFPTVNRPGHEAYHSLSYSAEVKNEWNYTSTHQRLS
jgi:hypothetical protein